MSERIDLPLAPAPRVSILVPVTGDARAIELLGPCLVHLAHRAGEAPFETLLLLNQASAELRDWVASTVTGARTFASDVNLGLAGGLQLLRSHARGELLISIHQDTEVEPGWLRALVATADARPDAGAIGSLVLDVDGVTVQAAGWVMCNDAATLPPWWGGPPPHRASFAGLEAFGVDYTPSSAVLVRAETWDAFGGPDEGFYPAYYVDVDLAMGVRSVGRSVLVEPRSVARHHRGSATTQRYRSFLAERNRARFLVKWARLLDRFLSQRDADGGVGPLVARAAQEAERCRATWARATAVPAPKAAAPMVDQPALERRCVEREREVRRDYIAFLENRVHALERELTARAPALEPVAADHQPP